MSIKPRTEFARLLHHCGLSARGASRLLNEKYWTIRNWIWGQARTPEPVLQKMREFAQAVDQHFPDARDHDET